MKIGCNNMLHMIMSVKIKIIIFELFSKVLFEHFKILPCTLNEVYFFLMCRP